ncbi:conjugal transfer transcriptional regulator TraJ [Salmonella enterica]|nr:conjugal transfer transcriptional regulator TraJ [Salmonella enterica]EKE1575750.1 conjugal transfer transcriptional regulator TraJ [Salmonella enterica]
MCAMDRRERALISQLHFPHSLGEAISFLKYPVCVRFEDGSFINANNCFEKSIGSSFNSCNEWFDSLTLECKLQLSRSEIESCSSIYGVNCNSDILLNNMLWSVIIESIITPVGYFFIWRFILVADDNLSSFVVPKYSNELITHSDEYVGIEPYLIGFSHHYSSAMMNITVSKSKKKTMKLFKRYGFSSRDRWLDEMIRMGKILHLYAKVKGILRK